jgi:hypothetical protein
LKISDSQKKSIEAILALTPALRGRVERETFGAGGVIEKEAIRSYQRFLILRVLYPEKILRPFRLADEVWHLHLLDTRRYAQDCQTIFGEFLHHDPSVMDDRNDAESVELCRQVFSQSAWGKMDPMLHGLTLSHDENRLLKASDCESCA